VRKFWDIISRVSGIMLLSFLTFMAFSFQFRKIVCFFYLGHSVLRVKSYNG